MAKLSGRLTKAYFAGYDLSGDLNEASVKVTFDMNEISGFGDAKKSFVLGLEADVIGFKGFLGTGAAAVHALLSARIGASDVALITWGTAVGAVGAAGSAMTLSHYEGQVAVNGPGLLTSDFANAAEAPGLDFVTVLAGHQSHTAAEAAIDDSAGSNNGMRAYLEQISVSAGTPVVVVQHSTTGTSAWSDLITFTGVAGRSAQAGAASGTVRQFRRMSVSGGTGIFVVATRRL